MFAYVFILTGTIHLRDSATRRTAWRTSRNTSIDDMLWLCRYIYTILHLF